MVVVSAPSVDNICESFTHNLLTWVQGNPIFLSLTGTHKECIYNESKFESDFGGGQHVCACVVMGDQQYYLHSHIKFVPPRKPGLSPTYPPNPTHGYIAVTDRQHKKNLHNYHLVKNMNRYLKKISVAAIYDQRIQGAKYMVIGYANKSFVELMDWIYVRYEQIIPRDLIRNQDEIQAK